MTVEEKLKKLILEQYRTMDSFCKAIQLPNSTLTGILKNGIGHASLSSIRKICQALGLRSDKLAEGQIIADASGEKETDLGLVHIQLNGIIDQPISIDGRPLTDQERQTIKDSIEIAIEIIKRRA